MDSCPEINVDGNFQVFESNLFVSCMFVNLDLFAQFLKEVCKSLNALVADLCIWTLFAQFLCLCHHKELI